MVCPRIKSNAKSVGNLFILFFFVKSINKIQRILTLDVISEHVFCKLSLMFYCRKHPFRMSLLGNDAMPANSMLGPPT